MYVLVSFVAFADTKTLLWDGSQALDGLGWLLCSSIYYVLSQLGAGGYGSNMQVWYCKVCVGMVACSCKLHKGD